jgi:hypothetical protein
MRLNDTKIITELQTHDFRSLQFFIVAAGYFEHRLRSVRIGCMFCFFLAVMSALFCFVPWFPWWMRIYYAACSVCLIYICWNPYRVALHSMRMLSAARHLDQHHQLECLELLATLSKTRKNMRYFWGVDPIAHYVVRVLRHEKPAAS